MLGFKLVILLVLTVVSSTIASDVYADSIIVTFDKNVYQTGDSLLVTGQISEVKMPIIAMSIFDPNGQILAANSLEIDPDGIFTKTIFLASPFYEKSGEYKIKLDYGTITKSEFFTISNPDVAIVVEESAIPEIITLSTDKSQYTDGDTITISGSVSTSDSSTVLIGVYDTFGAPAGFYFGNVDSNLNFSTSFLAKAGVNFKVDGTYSIKAHYAESSKTAEFDFFKVIEDTQVTIEDTQVPSVEETQVIQEPSIEDTQVAEDTTSVEKPVEKTQETKVNETNTDTSLESTSQPNNESVQTESEIISTNVLETDSKNKQTQSNDKSIVQTQNENKTTVKEKPNDKIAKEPEKQDNLTVEDIELGKILNQINLSCDSSKYVDSITYYDGMGPALYRLCNFDDSLQFFDQSLKTEPDNVEFLTNKGSALGKLGFFSEAIMYYDYALEIDPDFLPAINNKANILANQEKFEDAKILYESAIEKNPNYITARKNLSLISNELIQEKQVVSEKQTIQKPILIVQNDNPQEEIVNEIPMDTKTEKPSNFFEEISLAFSSLGSLFGFK